MNTDFFKTQPKEKRLTQNEIHEVKAAVSAEIKRLEKFVADYSDSPDCVYKMLVERSNQSINILLAAYNKLG